jgi:hypothetical protein
MTSDESGQLSLDFLAGFTIFMIAFIMVVTMVSGYFVGLQSRTIDYDAVAYRTGVILVEDPGYTQNNQTAWELNDLDHKWNILRLGLAYSDDPSGSSRNNPNVLSKAKVDKFFNKTYFSSTADYRQRLIFGDYPYNFNIHLLSMDGAYNYFTRTSDNSPNEYGYIRRIVKIREPSIISMNAIDCTPINLVAGTYSTLSIPMDFSALYSYNPPYNIDPLQDPVIINIINFDDPAIGGSNLQKVELLDAKGGVIETFSVNIDDVSQSSGPVSRSIMLDLEPGSFRTPFADKTSQLTILYTFSGPGIGLSGSQDQYFNMKITPADPTGTVNWPWPDFIPAIMEVKVW